MTTKEQLIEDIKQLSKILEEVSIEAVNQTDIGESDTNAYEVMMYVLQEAYISAVNNASAQVNNVMTLKGSGETN